MKVVGEEGTSIDDFVVYLKLIWFFCEMFSLFFLAMQKSLQILWTFNDNNFQVEHTQS